MHVLCPSCAAQYDVPLSQMTRSRLLRCARCNTEWRVPPAVVQEVWPVADAVPGSMPALPSTPDPGAASSMQPLVPVPIAPSDPGRRAALWILLWLLSFVVIVAGLYAVWHWRGAIGHRWPPSLRVLRMLPATGHS